MTNVFQTSARAAGLAAVALGFSSGCSNPSNNSVRDVESAKHTALVLPKVPSLETTDTFKNDLMVLALNQLTLMFPLSEHDGPRSPSVTALEEKEHRKLIEKCILLKSSLLITARELALSPADQKAALSFLEGVTETVSKDIALNDAHRSDIKERIARGSERSNSAFDELSRWEQQKAKSEEWYGFLVSLKETLEAK